MQDNYYSIEEIKQKCANMRVLVAEDDEVAAGLVGDFCGKFFNEVNIAFNGAQGLELYQNGGYDLVISDLSMPIMDGFEMIGKIFELNKDAKIIVMTAFQDAEYVHRCIKMGVKKVVFKPLDFGEFLIMLHKVVVA